MFINTISKISLVFLKVISQHTIHVLLVNFAGISHTISKYSLAIFNYIKWQLYGTFLHKILVIISPSNHSLCNFFWRDCTVYQRQKSLKIKCVTSFIKLSSHKMNGPQRTACLAKGYINNQFSLTFPRGRTQLSSMVTSLTMSHVRQAEHRQTDRQYAILSLAGSQNLCQTMNGSVETACVTKR